MIKNSFSPIALILDITFMYFGFEMRLVSISIEMNAESPEQIIKKINQIKNIGKAFALFIIAGMCCFVLLILWVNSSFKSA